MQEAYSFSNGAPICQFPMSNPISDYYSNGAACPTWAECPDPMASYTPGETFSVMWFARNHAVENQSPGTVYLYVSPMESNTQGSDVSQSVMESNMICSGPFMNCGGINQDTTPCTLTCKMPTSLAKGTYTMWWKWVWQGSAMYSTCADILITSGSSGTPAPTPTPPSTPSTTGKVISTPSTTGKVVSTPSTTGKVISTPSTTGKVVSTPSTTGRVASTPSTTGTAVSTPSTTGTAVSTPATTGVAASTSNNTCSGNKMRCADSTHYQTCFNGVFAAPQSCQAGLICQSGLTGVYCTRPGETIKEVSGAMKMENPIMLCVLLSLIVSFFLRTKN